MNMINIGDYNFVAVDRVISVVSPDTQSIKNILSQVKENPSYGKVIDCTKKKGTGCVIVCSDNVFILSHRNMRSIANRLMNVNKKEEGTE